MHNNIIRLFKEEEVWEPLTGGQNESFKSGNYVFKPARQPDLYGWIAKNLAPVYSDEIILSKPLPSLNGNFIEKGYGATAFVPGQFYPGRMEAKLNASKKFHSLIKHIAKPDDFDDWDHPWNQAQSIAWGMKELPRNYPLLAYQTLKSLRHQLEPVSLPYQLIHSDLAGNILFNGEHPVIIDFSPGFYPVEYAHTLLIIDSIAWHQEPIESLELLQLETKLRNQLLLRALIFRLAVPLCFSYENMDRYVKERVAYDKIIRPFIE